MTVKLHRLELTNEVSVVLVVLVAVLVLADQVANLEIVGPEEVTQAFRY
jgi:hypothetical protein